MLIASPRRECFGSDSACSVDSQNLALLWLQNIGGRFQSQLLDSRERRYAREQSCFRQLYQETDDCSG